MSLVSSYHSCRLLSRVISTKIQKRFSTREAIHRYVEPDKFKKHMLAATQPYIKRRYELPSEKCKGNIPNDIEMHPLEKIYVDEVIHDVETNDFVIFIQHNYTPFQSERVYKNTLIKSGGIFRSHKNTVYKEAFKKLGVDDRIQHLFVTRNSLVIGQIDKLPACVVALKKMPQFLLLGGCIDKEIYTFGDLTAISSEPRIDICRANLLSILETPSVDLSYNLEQYISMNEAEDVKSDSTTSEQTNPDCDSVSETNGNPEDGESTKPSNSDQ